MGDKIERAHHNFCMVRNLIDPMQHQEAYRIVHFIPTWFFFDVESEKQAKDKAEFIINDVRFWQWYIRQEAVLHQTRDILLALAIFSVVDDERKVLTDEEVKDNIYYRQIEKFNHS